jgi:hypothetical protein
MHELQFPNEDILDHPEVGCIEAIGVFGGSAGASVDADFQLTKLDNGDWRLRAISSQGDKWLKANEAFPEDGCITMSLAAVNSFLTRSKSYGLRTEYLGPVGSSLD